MGKKKTEIIVISEEEILNSVKGQTDFCAQIVKATEKPVLDGCEICATVLHDKILNWSIYHNGEYTIRFKTCKEAIQFLKDSES